MNKRVLLRINAVVFIIICFGFSSCSKDDDNGLDSSIAQEIIGTWYANDTSIKRYCTVNFYSDGTGDFYSEYHGKYGHSDSEMTGNFTWKCDGNRIITYGEYVYIDYNDGTIDTDFDPEVIYVYDGYYLIGGRYSGDASYYTRDGNDPTTTPVSPGGTNKDDITCHVGFDNSFFPTIDENGTYLHQIYLGFGVSKGNYSAGVEEFGIAVKTEDGTITNKNSKKSGSIYVSSLYNYKYFSALLLEDKAYDWGVILYIRSKSKKIVLDYYVRYYNSKKNEWVDGADSKFTYEPKTIAKN